MAAKRNVAPWQWACDDPRSLERLGLRLIESVPVTRPPAGLRAELPARYRYLLPLADPDLRQAGTVAQPVPGWLTSPASDGTCGDGRSRRSTVSSSS